MPDRCTCGDIFGEFPSGEPAPNQLDSTCPIHGVHRTESPKLDIYPQCGSDKKGVRVWNSMLPYSECRHSWHESPKPPQERHSQKDWKEFMAEENVESPKPGTVTPPRTREKLAQWFFDSEAEVAEQEDEVRGHAATSYARWPEDAAIQPYCRWAYRRADAFLAKFGTSQPPESGTPPTEEAERAFVAEFGVKPDPPKSRAYLCCEVDAWEYRREGWLARARQSPSAKELQELQSFRALAAETESVVFGESEITCRNGIKHDKSWRLGNCVYCRAEAAESEASLQPSTEKK